MSRRRIGLGLQRFAWLVLLALFSFGPASAVKFVKSEEVKVLEPQADTALVYFVRLQSDFRVRKLALFLDETPVGYLPGKSYLAYRAVPGSRIFWGLENWKALPVNLVAGRIYIYRIRETWENVPRYVFNKTSGQMMATQGQQWKGEWDLMEHESIRAIVEASSISFVTPTDDGLAELRKAGDKKSGKARRERGMDSVAATLAKDISLPLPQTFQRVDHRSSKKLGLNKILSFRTSEGSGDLVVDDSGVEFRTTDQTLRIPFPEIRSISTGTLGFDKATNWVILEYGSTESPQLAAFRRHIVPRSTADDLLLSTIRAAQESRSLPPLEQVKKGVDQAEVWVSAGFLQNASSFSGSLAAEEDATKWRQELRRVDPLLSELLRNSPENRDLLFLRARLEMAFDSITPLEISHGSVNRPDSLGEGRDALITLNRILESHPDDLEVMTLMARLCARRDWLTGEPRDIGRAITLAKKAVEKKPSEMPYREALAQYLILAGRSAEVMPLFAEIHAEKHPIPRLLLDRTHFPVPDGLKENEARQGLGNMPGVRMDYLEIRSESFETPKSASEMEQFFGSRWPNLHLQRIRSAEEEGGENRMYAAYLEWKGDELRTLEPAPTLDDGPPKGVSGLLIMVFEGPSQESGAEDSTAVASADRFLTQVVIWNNRDLSEP